MLCYTILYSTLLYSTLLYSTLLYSTLLYSTLLYYTILYYIILYYTILYPAVPPEALREFLSRCPPPQAAPAALTASYWARLPGAWVRGLEGAGAANT